MAYETLNLRQAAALVHLDENELRHCAQRGEIAAAERGGEWRFERRALDEWAQRDLLADDPRGLAARHRAMLEEDRREEKSGWGVADLLDAACVDLDVQARGRAGVIRDLTDLADRGGRVYDPESLYRELVAREEAASTAVGAGVALLHPRYHDPYLFEEGFIAYGRSARGVFFGAPDGEPTRHFFLICLTDREMHLHALARLAVLAHGTDLLARLDAAMDAAEAIEAVRACEADYR